MYPRTFPVVIAGNTFSRNAGYLDANVIFIRARGESAQNVYSTIPSTSSYFCSGYHFQSNTFTNNMGCQGQAGGVIRFECVNYADSATGNDRISAGSISGVSSSYCSVNTASYTTSNVVSTYGSYTADLRAINFKSNTYTQNFYTGG